MMKLFFTILSLSAFKALATTYYVSNAGSDANNGTSTGSSWQTISKVNAYTFASGDSILLKSGDTWNEQLIVPRTNLYFGAYSTGNKPIITGFQTLSGFSQAGNVWTKVASGSTATQNCVLLNGVFAYKARIPNTGYSTFTSYSGDSIINTSLTGTPSYVGKEIVVRTATWIIDVTKVLTQSTGQLKLSPKLTTTPALLGNGYFFQNDVSFIDTVNEYSYDSTTKSLSVYSASTPTVQISIYDTLVKCKKSTTLENIAFTGGNKLIVQVDTSCTVNNCLIQYGGWDAIAGEGTKGTVVIDNDSIVDAYNNGMAVDWIAGGQRLTITNNYLKKIGSVAGMGKSGNGTYTGILVFADTNYIEYNRLDSIGYNAIHFQKATVKHNYITNFGFTKVDAGGIYTFVGLTGNIIRGNIVGNGLGNTQGISGNNIANGIYIDDVSAGQTVDSNTVFNCKWASLFVHVASSGNIFTNNLFEDSVDRPFFNNGTSGLTIRKNIFYSRNASIDAFYSDNTTSQTVDSNYYLRPSDSTNLIHWGSSFYDVATFSNDAHGRRLPTDISINTSIPAILVINPSKTSASIALDVSGTYVDMNGRVYTNSITLQPYCSTLLFRTTYSKIQSFFVNGVR